MSLVELQVQFYLLELLPKQLIFFELKPQAFLLFKKFFLKFLLSLPHSEFHLFDSLVFFLKQIHEAGKLVGKTFHALNESLNLEVVAFSVQNLQSPHKLVEFTPARKNEILSFALLLLL